MPGNQGKWKDFIADKLYANPGTGQNLNKDLQEALADEQDAVLRVLIGEDGAVFEGFEVSAAGGLVVNISAGQAFVLGQFITATNQIVLSGLPASTTGIKVYLAGGTPFNTTLHSWPASIGHTTGALGAGQMLLALVGTDGSGVISVSDQRVLVSAITALPTADQIASMENAVPLPTGSNPLVTEGHAQLPTEDEKAALAGAGGTPSGTNPYVVESHSRLPTADQTGGLVNITTAAPAVNDDDPRLTDAREPLTHSHVIAHASLTGLLNDDHTQYRKVGETSRLMIEAFYPDPTSAPTAVLRGSTPVLSWAPGAGALEKAYVTVPLPPDFDVTQASSLRLIGSPLTSHAGLVVMAGFWLRVGNGLAINGAGTAFSTTLDPYNTAYIRYTHTLLSLVANTFQAGDILTLQLYRDRSHASNTHTGAYDLIALELEYKTRRA